MAGVYVFSIIISKLGYWSELDLIVLLKIDESLEINFYDTILPFSLFVNLQIKSNGNLMLIDKEVAKQ